MKRLSSGHYDLHDMYVIHSAHYIIDLLIMYIKSSGRTPEIIYIEKKREKKTKIPPCPEQ